MWSAISFNFAGAKLLAHQLETPIGDFVIYSFNDTYYLNYREEFIKKYSKLEDAKTDAEKKLQNQLNELSDFVKELNKE